MRKEAIIIFKLRLKDLREEAGLSQYAFAAKIGVAQSTVGGWEAGKREPNFETMQKIASFFGVSVDNLLSNDTEVSSKKKGIKIPVLGEIPAGVPVEAIQEILDYEEITEEMANTGSFFALLIKGDSMSPQIKEKDIVIIRQQPDVESGEIAIVFVNGEDATCKKLIKHENGISLVPLNQAYSPKFYTWKEAEEMPITVLGRVVESRRKF